MALNMIKLLCDPFVLHTGIENVRVRLKDLGTAIAQKQQAMNFVVTIFIFHNLIK